MCICMPEELICTLLTPADFSGMCNSCWIYCCIAFRLGDCKTGQYHEKRFWQEIGWIPGIYQSMETYIYFSMISNIMVIFASLTNVVNHFVFHPTQDQVNKSDIDEKTKATLMLCYGYVALYAPASLIVSRLETTILKAINPHFNHVKVGRCP